MPKGCTGDNTHRRDKNKINALFGGLQKDVAGYEGRCLFVVNDSGQYCNKPVGNKCHIVSESSILNRLKGREGKVLELQWGISQWRRLLLGNEDPAAVRPFPKPPADTCVGRFACKPHSQDDPYSHDDEFQKIDVAEPDFSDPINRFLSGYRLVLFQADQYRLAMWLQDQWIRGTLNREARRRLGRHNVTLQQFMKGMQDSLQKAESLATLLGKNWHSYKTSGTLDPGLVSALVVTFRSKLQVAGGAFYGKATAITVFPIEDDWYKMGIHYLTSESDLAREDIDRLAAVARASEETDTYGVMVTNELMKKGGGALAMSPMSFEGLHHDDRSTIQTRLAEQLQETELLKPLGPQLLEEWRRRSRGLG